MENKMLYISVVTPVYGCSSSLLELYIKLKTTLEKITNDFEIILVNDASPDESWSIIDELCKKDRRVKGIHLSRNFGQHYAITAGLDYAKGEWVVVMDCDLQDRPEEVLNLYNKAIEGYDIVLGRRVERKDGFLKKITSRMFFAIFSYLTDTKFDHTVSNFGIFKKPVIDSVNKMGDYYRVFLPLVHWVGFTKTSIKVEHSLRSNGKSSYNFKKLFNLSFDMIVSFSDKPMKLAMKLGVLISMFSFLFGIYYLILYFKGVITVPGYTSLIITIMFSTGIIIFFIGLIGIYIGKLSIQNKNRPKYIIKTLLNCK